MYAELLQTHEQSIENQCWQIPSITSQWNHFNCHVIGID